MRLEQTKVQNRLDKLYEDRLDGFIEPAFFERKTQEWRQSQARIAEQIVQSEDTNQEYFKDGVRLLTLKKGLFPIQKAKSARKAQIAEFRCSNSTWKDQTLTATFRQPFDLLALTNTAGQREKAIFHTS